ncbi:MAG: polymerase subunit beta, partial [Sphingomonadales bacterium]|nr:polymerase subunit beta [Sphingomonadales bacterium]
MPRPFFMAISRSLAFMLQTNGGFIPMKATIERATLLKSLGHVQSVVERRNTIPILSNVLIEALAEGGIRLMATDLDLQIL